MSCSLHQIPTPVLSLSISVQVLAYAYNQPLSHEKSYKIGNFIIIRVLCKIDAVTLMHLNKIQVVLKITLGK